MSRSSAAAACFLTMLAGSSAAVAQNLSVPAGDAKGMTPPIDRRSQPPAPADETRRLPQSPSAPERASEVPPPGAR